MNKKLNVYLAGPRGFCAGVDRAIEMVKSALKKYGKPVYVRHEIVHNKYVVDSLKSEGAIFVEDLNEIDDKSRPVIFSAHGVPKSVPEEASKLNLLFFDATCPLVSKIHKEVEQFDKKKLPVILIGHRNHPEVIGTMGQTNNEIYLVEKVSDVKKLPINKNEKISYVTQTTLSVDDTHDIIENINSKFPAAEIRNDICYATTNRQAAVKELAKKTDLILVVGSPNSSNSVRLMEHARSAGVTAYRIEGIEEIEEQWFKNVGIIGLTAGASVPDELLDPIINLLIQKGIKKIDTITVAQETVEFKPPNDLPIPKRTLTQ